jgi:surface polysaccharide O-acyltransferase-like enzyme
LLSGRLVAAKVWLKGIIVSESDSHREHLVYVDVLNIIACFAVVMLHVSLNVFNPLGDHWVRAVLFQAIAIFAVPVFFMISGMNLIGYSDKYDARTFFKKRAWRVGRALILASLFCYVLFCMFPFSFYGAEQYAGKFGLLDLLVRFLTNSVNDTYWFLYTIIYLYILTPLLTRAKTSKKLLEYLLLILFSVSFVIPLIEKMGVPKEYFGTLFNWPFFASSSLFYYILGFYIKKYVKELPPIWLTAGMFVVSAAAMFFGGLYTNGYFSQRSETYSNYVIGTASPLCALEAVSLFLLLMSAEEHLKKYPSKVLRGVKEISGASLGVYLFHILIINWAGVNLQGRIAEFWGNHMEMRTVVVYAITLVLVVLAKRAIALCKGHKKGRIADNVS